MPFIKPQLVQLVINIIMLLYVKLAVMWPHRSLKLYFIMYCISSKTDLLEYKLTTSEATVLLRIKFNDSIYIAVVVVESSTTQFVLLGMLKEADEIVLQT